MATLLPSIRYRIVDTATGAAIPGAKVYTYVAGTTTPKDSYTSSAASVANTNPVIADARGEVLIWLSGAYKIRINDADDNLIDEEDNVVDLTSGGTFSTPTFTGTVTYSGTTMTWSGNPTHSGNHTFSGNVTVNGNTAIGNAAGDTLIIAPSAVTWANGATHSGAHTFSGAVSLASTLAVTGAATLNGAVTLGDAAADTVTVNGAPAGLVVGGTWTPTWKGITNITGTTQLECIYIRIGSIVTFSGRVTINPAADSTYTELRGSLPIPSDLAGVSDLSGVCSRSNSISAPLVGQLEADVVNNEMLFKFTDGTGNVTSTWSFSGSYKII